MKKITLIKYFAFLITCLCVVSFGFGQTKLAEITFENPGGYSTSILEFTDNTRDYFIRTDESNITGEDITNIQGSYYFAAQDIDGEGASLPVNIILNNVNISGYSSLEFRVHLAEDEASDANEDWDVGDYVHFSYDIDNTGTFSNLIWIENDGSTFNSAPFIDTNYDGTGDGAEITNNFTQFIQAIIGTGNLLDIEIEFNLNAADEDIAIDNIEIWGTLIPCGAPVIWDGTVWDNANVGPDINTAAIINGDYNTTTASFSACSLIVNNNSTLTISDNTHVEIQNDITVDAGSAIAVQPYGAVVQINDLGNVTNNGSISVTKKTAPLNVALEYTYWSSPVLNETIGSGLLESNASRRYSFNAQNFLDATMETGNNNATVAGQDDIDDNGDDWQGESGATVMQPGVGYASTHDPNIFIFPGVGYDYVFEGPFNNGVITVPVYRNDSELNDYNWNFIGNPYPSAINADLFLGANSNIDTGVVTTKSIDGAIFLWSQNTPPSSTANGNQVNNFSSDDYAIINAVGQNAGGDGVTPTRNIPSGQGFFVSMSNTAPASLVSGSVYTNDVVFNNTMRVKGSTDNSQFFKNSSTKNKTSSVFNKLWVNLKSDNGIFNQVLIGYVNGSTKEYDGIAYDTPKTSSSTSAILYSIIENNLGKYAIQGKAPSDLNENEIIDLGFKTSIDVATLYTLSIAQFQGDFLNNNTVYLKDNLLGKTHNLSDSDYTFTSEVGEFNTRFKIAFSTQALSTDDISLNDNNLSIIELTDDFVTFKTANNLNIKTVTVFDLLGRQLYNLKGNNSSETYQLSNLKSTIFIAKVELSNGSIITKKAIKR